MGNDNIGAGFDNKNIGSGFDNESVGSDFDNEYIGSGFDNESIGSNFTSIDSEKTDDMLPPDTTPIPKEYLPVMYPVIDSKTSTSNPVADRDKKSKW